MAVRWLAFHLTDRCNLNCRHCLRDPGGKPLDIDVALLERTLDAARASYATEHIALTGGEPTLHPDLDRIVDALTLRGMTWNIVTNGSRMAFLVELLRAVPRRRDQLTFVDLSLDGAREETHDAIRGAGSHREVMDAVTLCKAHEIPFVLQMTVNALNAPEMEEFGLLAAELGAARASFCWLQPTGTELDARLALPPSAWQRVADRAERLAGILRIPVTTPEGFPRRQPFHVCDPMRTEILHVDVHGRLNLCCQHSGIPSDEGAPTDIVADLAEVPLLTAHAALLDKIHRYQLDKLQEISAGPLDAHDLSPCNHCLRYFGKPHWSATGAVGPAAARPRWRGAWARGEPGSRPSPKARLPTLR